MRRVGLDDMGRGLAVLLGRLLLCCYGPIPTITGRWRRACVTVFFPWKTVTAWAANPRAFRVPCVLRRGI